jgi:hypothetical protein
MAEQPTSFVYHGEPTREVHLAPDGTTFRLCNKDDTDCVASFTLENTAIDGDTIRIPPFTLSQA